MLFYLQLWFLCNLLVKGYKGVSTGGGVIQAKGLMGTQGVQTNVASPGCICNKSSVQVLWLTTKIPSAIKCKCPQRRATCLSRKLYATKGIREPSKYSSQVGGN